MITRPTRLFLISVAIVPLGLLTAACDTASQPSTTTTTLTGSPASPSPSHQVTSPDTDPPDEVTVHLAFSAGDGSDCSEVGTVARTIPSDTDPIAAAFELLVAGPTRDEVSAGASSVFSMATAGSVRSATLSGDLLAVDFRDFRNDLSNAATTCGSEALLAQLNGTGFQFPEVERITYSIDGSCEEFFNWLQSDCEELTRE